jgi:plasmid maintenance system antidote protein VapI
VAEKWDPDWTIRPGVTLEDWLDENHISVRVAAKMCRLSRERISGILDGSREITATDAAHLELGTLIPASLWLRLEQRYRADLAAGKPDASDT